MELCFVTSGIGFTFNYLVMPKSVLNFMIIVILNLGTPLDYHLIFGAGAYTAIYIIAAAAVINEIIAVTASKKAFEWAEKMNQKEENEWIEKKIR